jgi:hypothetical protein
VIGADDPDGTIRFQHALTFGEPLFREAIVVLEAPELVPSVIDAVHNGVVGAEQFALKLEIVRGVGENEIDRSCGKLAESAETIAVQDSIHR